MRIENDQHRVTDEVRLILIGAFALIALLVTVYAVMAQYDGIFLERYYLIPHLYIIPIILVALWYPRRGMQVVLLLIASIAGLTGFIYLIRHTFDPILSLMNAGVDVWIVAVLALSVRSRLSEAGMMPVSPEPSTIAKREPEINDRPLEGFLEALKLPDEGIRQEAVRALADFSDPCAIKTLMDALQDESSSVREEAIRSLGKVPHPDTVPPLLELLKDENRLTREQAVGALGGKGEIAVGPLLGALADPDWHVRMGAAIALRIIGDARAVEPLIQLLADDNRFVRREAVKSLGRFGDERAQHRLLDLRADPDQTVRIRAEVALMKIHGRHFAVDESHILFDENKKH
ncbi:MAG: HEAT repeat domain-containing protein [Methanomicrobiales archaeon]|nr:HEAT repeat domain-containing protein [Methanomicrobiales archaeon]